MLNCKICQIILQCQHFTAFIPACKKKNRSDTPKASPHYTVPMALQRGKVLINRETSFFQNFDKGEVKRPLDDADKMVIFDAPLYIHEPNP